MTYDVIIVTGGRDIDHQHQVALVLQNYLPFNLLVHGDCQPRRGSRGVDWLADQWARQEGIERDAMPADWDRYGLKAGPVRNGEMLDKYPHGHVVAIPGPNSTGTWNCMKQAVQRKIKVDCYLFTGQTLVVTKDWKP